MEHIEALVAQSSNQRIGSRTAPQNSVDCEHSTGEMVVLRGDVSSVVKRVGAVSQTELPTLFSAPWKGAVPQRVRTPPGNSRSSR